MRLRQLVTERESEFMSAIVKDGTVATTATAATVALNPATATKVRPCTNKDKVPCFCALPPVRPSSSDARCTDRRRVTADVVGV